MKPEDRKIRRIRAANGDGRPIIPNIGIEKWYYYQIEKVLNSMMDDYKDQILADLNQPNVEEFFVGDSSISALFDRTLSLLSQKWSAIFKGLARRTSDEFVKKASSAAIAATDFSLSTKNVIAPRSTYTENTRQAMGAYVKFNETLISGISDQYHKRIYEAVMLSLTSPEEGKQGQKGIISALNEIGISEKKRARTIAMDQTSKMYGALAVDRMKQSGVKYFRWKHTFGPRKFGNKGRVQWREDHEALDGEVFSVDDPDLWVVGKYFRRKGDIGIPGYAINCRCRMVPIVLPTPEDLASIERRYGKAARKAMEF